MSLPRATKDQQRSCFPSLGHNSPNPYRSSHAPQDSSNVILIGASTAGTWSSWLKRKNWIASFQSNHVKKHGRTQYKPIDSACIMQFHTAVLPSGWLVKIPDVDQGWSRPSSLGHPASRDFSVHRSMLGMIPPSPRPSNSSMLPVRCANSKWIQVPAQPLESSSVGCSR